MLKTAISDKFQFAIINRAERSVRIALATGHIDVEGFDVVSNPTYDSEDPDPAVPQFLIEKHMHNTENLAREGYAVDTVLDDAEIRLADSKSDRPVIIMACVDSSKTIRHAKASLMQNFRWIKKITLAANSTAAFQASMSIATLSAFHKENERDIDLNDYFSVQQFQNDKIVMEFEHGELQWNDDFFWALNVPTGVTEQISVEFYD